MLQKVGFDKESVFESDFHEGREDIGEAVVTQLVVLLQQLDN